MERVKRIKNDIVYNAPTEFVIALILVFVAVGLMGMAKIIGIESLTVKLYLVALGFTLFSLMIIFLFTLVNKKIKKYYKWHFFYIKKSIFRRNCRWINQKKKNKTIKQNQCPLKNFMSSLALIKKDVEAGEKDILYMAVTHEEIVKRIKKSFNVVNCEFSYETSLKNLQKRIRTNKCKKKCNIEQCVFHPNNVKKEKTKFYAISFKGKNSTDEIIAGDGC